MKELELLKQLDIFCEIAYTKEALRSLSQSSLIELIIKMRNNNKTMLGILEKLISEREANERTTNYPA